MFWLRLFRPFKNKLIYDMHQEDLKAYLDFLKPEGKIILDIGASSGNSARLFLDNGAKKVICVEIDRSQASKICLPRTIVLNEAFRLEHLQMDHDAMKCDIEGYEIDLLQLDPAKMKPSLVEVHNMWLIERFKAAGWRIYSQELPWIALMVNRP